MRFLRIIGAALAAWALVLTPVAEAQFKPTASVTRTLPSIAGLRPQDVFATSLYTGTGASQTVNNGLDLLGKGGLAWFKNRSASASHPLIDTARGASVLYSDLTQAEGSAASVFTGFTNTGFGITSGGTVINSSGNSYVNWSFRRAPKFFDIVPYTGDGTSGRVIPHALGIKPGMIIVKRRSTANGWYVQHRSLTASQFLILNDTAAAGSAGPIWDNVEPTDTAFTVGVSGNVNLSGSTYVAYLFAHDPDTTNGIVQCGSGNATLPWDYQWIIWKYAATAANWFIQDTARGFNSPRPTLFPNTSDAETTSGALTGDARTLAFGAPGNNPVWCAIRAPIQ